MQYITISNWRNMAIICRICCLLAVFFYAISPVSAQLLYGTVTDAVEKQPLPFATVKIAGGSEGLITDMDGNFTLQRTPDIQQIEVSYLGYQSRIITLLPGSDSLHVLMQPSGKELEAYIFKPPYDKIRRIINLAIANRKQHNPEQYDRYRCHIYYKMIADIRLPDSSLQQIEADTSRENQLMYNFLTGQHLLMSETYSIRTWQKPQQLQEDVVATRLSGFKKSIFTSLITDVLPFHAYSDYLTLNGKDYHNPISKGFGSRYVFNLTDELIREKDTLWQLSFRPANKQIPQLSGSVYISSANYAIAYLLAEAVDRHLKRQVKIEHAYTITGGKWFPKELNYIIDWQQEVSSSDSGKTEKVYFSLVMNGRSKIDSVSWNEGEKKFRFDKARPVRLLPGADEQSGTKWEQLRPIALNLREQRTYQFNDSIMEAIRFSRFIPYIDKLTEGKIPVGAFDFDLKRLYSFNRYERSRLGIGVQTNERLIPWLSVGGWAGYGFGDKAWKYGGFMEITPNAPSNDFMIRLAWDNDIRDPGRISLHREIDRSYLRMFLMNRVDAVESLSLSVSGRLGYWEALISGSREDIRPMYPYALLSTSVNGNHFKATEASLQLRYAFAERRAPMFGRYYNTGTKYPVWYGKVAAGTISGQTGQADYLQALTAVSWRKHLNRIGHERFLILAGKSWSTSPLPVSKLFAGNGFRFDQVSLYAFGGMLTMYPYEYYSDQFVQASWRHDFDWKFYTTAYSAPFLSIGHNMLWGTLDNPAAHHFVPFSIPAAGYHETGIMLNSLLRIDYMKLYYISVHIGYYYHWAPVVDFARHGRMVYGLGFEL